MMKLYALVCGFIVVVGLLFLGYALGQYLATVWGPQETVSVSPRFHARQCFVFLGERESWEAPIDGQILIVGKTHYLWEPWASVQPNHGKKPWRMGREYGISSDIQEFDAVNHPVDCQWEKG